MGIPAADNQNSAGAGLCTDSSPDIGYNWRLLHYHNMAAGRVVQQAFVRMKWGKVQY